MSGADRRVLILAAIALGLITWREFHASTSPEGMTDLPNPASYGGAVIVYSIAALVSELNGTFAVALAAGWTLYILYQNVDMIQSAARPTIAKGAVHA